MPPTPPRSRAAPRSASRSAPGRLTGRSASGWRSCSRARGGPLRGRRVGLICNPTAVDGRLRHAADLLHALPGVTLAALFGPEHGVRGDAQYMAAVAGEVRRRPPASPSTRCTARRATRSGRAPRRWPGSTRSASTSRTWGPATTPTRPPCCSPWRRRPAAGLAFVVLDRPNPIGGQLVEGPALRPGFESFCGLHDLAPRHGLTVGELARLFVAERGLDLDLTVVPCQGWRRGQGFRATGLPWVFPSPNMPTPETALVYPGMCLLEGTNLSEGRGTTRPFELLGAPWLDPAPAGGGALGGAAAGRPLPAGQLHADLGQARRPSAATASSSTSTTPGPSAPSAPAWPACSRPGRRRRTRFRLADRDLRVRRRRPGLRPALRLGAGAAGDRGRGHAARAGARPTPGRSGPSRSGAPGSSPIMADVDARPEIALLGGSFNPPHVAHVMAAWWALATQGVREVWLLPTWRHPFGKELAPWEDRVRMCELAIRAAARRPRLHRRGGAARRPALRPDRPHARVPGRAAPRPALRAAGGGRHPRRRPRAGTAGTG